MNNKTIYSMNVDLETYIDPSRVGKFTGYIVIDDGVRSFEGWEREKITKNFFGPFFWQHRESLVQCGMTHGDIGEALFEAETKETLNEIEQDLTGIIHDARNGLSAQLITKREEIQREV
ncbi:hypothetical protein HY483_03705 [Candidatus Woesearchaeota archaeon]|nr:hypothetical protein [Candidatus Woesearchaeota archaeon]